MILFRFKSFRCVVVLFERNFGDNLIRRKYHLAENNANLSYIHHVGKKPLLYQTFNEIIDIAAENHPTRDAAIFVEEKKKITFHELKNQTNLIAAGLLDLGLKKGDKLALWAPNISEWYLSFLAAARIGVITVLVNPVFTLPELEYCIDKTKTSTILSIEAYRSQKYYEIINELCPIVDGKTTWKYLRNVIMADDSYRPGTTPWKKLLERGARVDKEALEQEKRKVNPDDAMTIQFTSGTTGKPKATVTSQFSFANVSNIFAQRYQLDKSETKMCLHTPFFHVFATGIHMLPCLITSTTLVVPSKVYNPLRTLQAIESERCTSVNGTPTMHVDLIKLQKDHNFDVSSLNYMISGGSPCPPSLFQNMIKYLGVKVVKSVYGLTETTGVVFTSLPGEEENLALETVGQVFEHLEARVVDQSGQLVPFGKPGELQLRGYASMLEYLDDPVKTAETLGVDGWLKTGDQFILHKNGYGQVVGRFKEMIIRGGENIFPREVEDFLNTHPEILETQVLGVEDDRLGEEVAVCIKTIDANTTLTLDDIHKFCNGKIAKFKIPKHLRIVTEFPKTSSGKIPKYKLKELFK